MQHFKLFCGVVVLLLMCLVLGCASPAKRTGFLQDYSNLKRGKHLENFWLNSALVNQKRYTKIFIAPIDIERISDQRGLKAEDCGSWLLKYLKNATGPLRKNFLLESSKDAQIKLEIAITEMTPGSAAGRMFAGEFGMGHAWVQVEGRGVDEETNALVFVFSDRRRASGAAGLADTAGDAGPGLVVSMLDRIAKDIVKELKEGFGF
jgi:hypothetical protein